jgi:small subunit ribosomal protein S4
MTHGHFMLNGKRVDIPSIRMSAGDVLVVRPHSVKSGYFTNLDDISPAPSDIPSWLKADRKKLQLSVVSLPTREDAELDINEQLIVEYYSR